MGGWGTRFLPATKTLPKELLPVFNKPLIQLAVEELETAGIGHVLLVISPGKESVQQHFDRAHGLERFLKNRGRYDLSEEIATIGSTIDIQYATQTEPLGLGHAVLTAKSYIGNEPFALLLPDDIIRATPTVTEQLLDTFATRQNAVVAVEEVREQDVSAYGIINPGERTDNLYRINGCVEKPPVDEAPSKLGIIGRYILTPDIFEALERTTPGSNGEIQLTDALDRVSNSGPAYGLVFSGTRYDCGTPLGLLKASLVFAMDDPGNAAPLREILAWAEGRV